MAGSVSPAARSPSPRPSPQRRGSHAGRATSLRVRTICERRAWHLPLPWGWGEGELSSRRFHGASSSEQVTLQTRGQFLAALDVNVRLAAIWENHPHHAKATSSLWPCRPPPGALTRRSHLIHNENCCANLAVVEPPIVQKDASPGGYENRMPPVRSLDCSERGHSCPLRACLIPLLPLSPSLPFPVSCAWKNVSCARPPGLPT